MSECVCVRALTSCDCVRLKPYFGIAHRPQGDAVGASRKDSSAQAKSSKSVKEPSSSSKTDSRHRCSRPQMRVSHFARRRRS